MRTKVGFAPAASVVVVGRSQLIADLTDLSKMRDTLIAAGYNVGPLQEPGKYGIVWPFFDIYIPNQNNVRVRTKRVLIHTKVGPMENFYVLSEKLADSHFPLVNAQVQGTLF